MDKNIETAAVLAMLKGLSGREEQAKLPPGEYKLDGIKVWVELSGTVRKAEDSSWTSSPVARTAGLMLAIERLDAELTRRGLPTETLAAVLLKSMLDASRMPGEDVDRLEKAVASAEYQARKELPSPASKPRSGALKPLDLKVDLEVIGGEA
jgi:hypothetical protein